MSTASIANDVTSAAGEITASSTVACPRHGLLDARADTPCPHCQSLLFDLSDRNARDVVRANRHAGLKGRRTILAVVVVALTLVVSVLRGSGNGVVGVDFVVLVVGAAVAIMGSAPLARLLERKPALRALDTWLKANRI